MQRRGHHSPSLPLSLSGMERAKTRQRKKNRFIENEVYKGRRSYVIWLLLSYIAAGEIKREASGSIWKQWNWVSVKNWWERERERGFSRFISVVVNGRNQSVIQRNKRHFFFCRCCDSFLSTPVDSAVEKKTGYTIIFRLDVYYFKEMSKIRRFRKKIALLATPYWNYA